MKAPAGTYRLEAKVMAYGSDRRISRLRAVLAGASPVLGEQIGETWTETARTGVCDFRVFSDAWGDDDDAAYDKISEAFEVEDEFGVAVLDAAKAAVMPFVSSGFGDGTFHVHILQEGRRTAGFEIEFITPEEPYPFGSAPAHAGEKQVKHAMLPNAIFGKAEPGKAAGKGEADGFMQMLASALGKATGGEKGAKGNLMSTLDTIRDQVRSQAEAATADWRRHVKEIRAKALPLHIQLLPLPESAWLTALPSAATAVACLRKAGFVPAGVFSIAGQPGLQVAGFANADGRIHASLIRAGERLFAGLVRRGVDGTIEEATNLPPGGSPLPDWIRRFHEPKANVGGLLNKFPARPKGDSWKPATPENFVSLSEEDYARHHAWLAERGGRTEAELRAGLKVAGKLPPSEEGEELARNAWNEEVEKSLWNWLKLQDGLPFKLDDVVDRLVVIHEGESPGLLANAYWCVTGDYSVKETEFAEGPARRAFERMVEARRACSAKS